jgi:hypothetical protein
MGAIAWAHAAALRRAPECDGLGMPPAARKPHVRHEAARVRHAPRRRGPLCASGPTPFSLSPITPFLNGERFDPETKRILGVAFEMVCIALETGACDDGVKQAIAAKLIALAKAGERNPDILCEQALKDIRGQQP